MDDKSTKKAKAQFSRDLRKLRRQNVTLTLATVQKAFDTCTPLAFARFDQAQSDADLREAARVRDFLDEALKIFKKITPSIAEIESGVTCALKLGDALACCEFALRPPPGGEYYEWLDIAWRHLGGCDAALQMAEWSQGSGATSAPVLWGSDGSALKSDVADSSLQLTNRELADKHNVSIDHVKRVKRKVKKESSEG